MLAVTLPPKLKCTVNVAVLPLTDTALTLPPTLPVRVRSHVWTDPVSIACLDSCRIHGIGQVDDEINRLRIDDAVARRGGGGHGKTHQISIGEGILLLCAVDGVAPVHP